MENPKVILSIVVPVYNVSKYLSKCLDSILDQNINKDDYEIIVVNDGSSDNSGDIAQDYANKYSNIILINQENKGLSGARNSGIKVAKGKYIQFVDSDDYLEPNVLCALLQILENDELDVIRFNYRNVNESYRVVEPNKEPKRYVDYSNVICDGITFLNERLGYGCYVWQFLLKTVLVKSIPFFQEGIYFEDVEWTPRLLVNAERVTSVDTIVYDYLVREGSITKGKTVEKKRKIIEDKMKLIESLGEYKKNVKDNRWFDGMISGMVISILTSVVTDFQRELKSYVIRLKQLNVFPLSDYHLNKGALRKRQIINISPYLFCFFLYLKSK